MTKEEYKEKIKQIDLAAQKEKQRLAVEFAMANNLVSKGDILTDHHQMIRVENITANGI